MIRYHSGIGMHIRNEHSLWRGSPLQDYFRAQGVGHPDSMSDALLEMYGQYLRGEAVRADSIIAVKRAELPPREELPPPE